MKSENGNVSPHLYESTTDNIIVQTAEMPDYFVATYVGFLKICAFDYNYVLISLKLWKTTEIILISLKIATENQIEMLYICIYLNPECEEL